MVIVRLFYVSANEISLHGLKSTVNSNLSESKDQPLQDSAIPHIMRWTVIWPITTLFSLAKDCNTRSFFSINERRFEKYIYMSFRRCCCPDWFTGAIRVQWLNQGNINSSRLLNSPVSTTDIRIGNLPLTLFLLHLWHNSSHQCSDWCI